MPIFFPPVCSLVCLFFKRLLTFEKWQGAGCRFLENFSCTKINNNKYLLKSLLVMSSRPGFPSTADLMMRTIMIKYQICRWDWILCYILIQRHNIYSEFTLILFIILASEHKLTNNNIIIQHQKIYLASAQQQNLS